MRKQNTLQAFFVGNGFRNLLFFLLLYTVGSPFLEPYPSLAIFVHISLSMALFAAVYTVNKFNKERSLAIALLVPLLLLYWLNLSDFMDINPIGGQFLFCIYYGLLVYAFISQIRKARRVDRNVLYITFSLYLILGLFWGSLYALLYQLSPGCFSGALLQNADNLLHNFNYFSFVTLTTLGYGDITPQTAGAAAVCQLEAIVGQFYTAVVVAWLVGMFVSEGRKGRDNSVDDQDQSRPHSLEENYYKK